MSEQKIGCVPDGYMPIPTAEQIADALENVRCYHDMSAELIAPRLLANLLAATTVKAEQAPTPEFVWVRLLEALAGDNGCPFTASTDDYREAKSALVQLIAAGLFRDDADSLDGDIWTIAAGEQSEAAARFASCADAYAVLSDVLNRVFERPDEAPSLPAAGSADLTAVRCQCCATEYPHDSYDAGFIAGSGMCQVCDAAMPPKGLPAAGSADLPPPDFTLDCGSQPCYYAETVQRIVAALSAQQSAHVSVPRELLERICWSVISSSDLHTHNEAVRELRALLNGGEA